MELEDDRKFLDYEIRDSRLQNKMLKITLSKSHNQCEELNLLNQSARDEIFDLSQNVNERLNESEVVYPVNQLSEEIPFIQDGLAQTTRKMANLSFQEPSMMEKKTDLTTGRLQSKGIENSGVFGNMNIDETDLPSKSPDIPNEFSEEDDMVDQVVQQDSRTNIIIRDTEGYATFMRNQQ